MVKSEVSSSMWLFGAEAYEFAMPVEEQLRFIKEREDRSELIIRELLKIPSKDMTQDESDRMRDCLGVRTWIKKIRLQLQPPKGGQDGSSKTMAIPG